MRFEFSAGGIVYRKSPDLQILVCQHSQHHGWVFPKGLIGDTDGNKHQTKSASAKSYGPASQSSSEASETKEEAALREVKEEAGIEARIEQKLEPVTYWYVWKGDPSASVRPVRDSQDKQDKNSGRVKIKKTVYYYTMKAVGGNITEHDNEMEEVEWIDFEDVEKRLTYPSDKKAWVEAKALISKIP